MRTPEAIITDLRNVLYWSQPNIKFDELSALINELEAIVTPTEEVIPTKIVEEVVVEETTIDTEQNVLIKNEEGIFEEITLAEESFIEVTEEVTKEPVVTKKTTKKK
jgi:UDP-3-O-[3-hydroxymyristoyl] glucosamine N-acyltransferase